MGDLLSNSVHRAKKNFFEKTHSLNRVPRTGGDMNWRCGTESEVLTVPHTYCFLFKITPNLDNIFTEWVEGK